MQAAGPGHEEAEATWLQETRHRKLNRRNGLTIFSHPLQTVINFLDYVREKFSATVYWAVQHWLTVRLLLPFSSIILALALVPGPHESLLQEMWIWVRLIAWWIGLGVSSSVGVGFGMHSGLFFLFPHIYLICHSAEICNSTLFDSRVNMWNSRLNPGDHFNCERTLESSSENEGPDLLLGVSLSGLLWHIIPIAILWGFGTAVGELPPYIAAKSYAEAKNKVMRNEGDELMEVAASDSAQCCHITWLSNVATKMATEMVPRYGAAAVIILSCWPNAFFDLCGVVCGRCLMPFPSFFTALCIGKGVIKPVLQSLFFIFIFSKKYDEGRATFITWIAEMPPFDKFINARFGGPQEVHDHILVLTESMREGINHSLSSEVDEATYPEGIMGVGPRFLSWLSSLATPSGAYNGVVLFFLVYFAITVLNQIAQLRQKELDDEEIERELIIRRQKEPPDLYKSGCLDFQSELPCTKSSGSSANP
eukprot:GHVN01019837.1.p1 GENE.GHVN01019837.1~~GHVN01019837.1.p1  ORF type:complete len:479 (+),score=18.24 GHVN01019837.1:129-1565(+)